MTPNARAIVRAFNTVLKANSTTARNKTKLVLSKVPTNASALKQHKPYA